jgi:hypothetical protein
MQCESTIKTYDYNFNKYKDIGDIKNPNSFFKKLINLKNTKNGKDISISTIKIILCSIIYNLKKEKGMEDILFQYSLLLNKTRNIAEKKERNHSIIHNFIPDWNDIIKIRNQQREGSKKYLILSLYTEIVPRREKDYVLLKYINKNNETIDPLFNYYIKDDGILVFNNYKTKKTFKRQIVDLNNNKLKEIINKYISDNNIMEGELILNYSSYASLHYILNKLLNCGGVDNIRHSYINNYYKDYKIPPSQIIEDLSRQMGHSMQTHLRYRKYS